MLRAADDQPDAGAAEIGQRLLAERPSRGRRRRRSRAKARAGRPRAASCRSGGRTGSDRASPAVSGARPSTCSSPTSTKTLSGSAGAARGCEIAPPTSATTARTASRGNRQSHRGQVKDGRCSPVLPRRRPPARPAPAARGTVLLVTWAKTRTFRAGGLKPPAKSRREKFWTGHHWQQRRKWHQDPNVFRYPDARAQFERDLPRLDPRGGAPRPRPRRAAAPSRRPGRDDGLLLRARAARPPDQARLRERQHLDPVGAEQHLRDPRLRVVVRDRQRERCRLPLRPRRRGRHPRVAPGRDARRPTRRGSPRPAPSSSPSGSPRSGRTARRRASSGAGSRRSSTTPTGTSSGSSTVDENEANIVRIVELIRSVNPSAPIVLTLSPVPLLATFRGRSCVTADAVSKAALRMAIDNVEEPRSARRLLLAVVRDRPLGRRAPPLPGVRRPRPARAARLALPRRRDHRRVRRGVLHARGGRAAAGGEPRAARSGTPPRQSDACTTPRTRSSLRAQDGRARFAASSTGRTLRRSRKRARASAPPACAASWSRSAGARDPRFSSPARGSASTSSRLPAGRRAHDRGRRQPARARALPRRRARDRSAGRRPRTTCRRSRSSSAEHEIRLIVPLADLDHLLLAERRTELDGALVLLPAPEVVRRTEDKYQAHVFFEEHGIPSPPSWLPGRAAGRAAVSGARQAPPRLRLARTSTAADRPRGARLPSPPNAGGLVRPAGLRRRGVLDRRLLRLRGPLPGRDPADDDRVEGRRVDQGHVDRATAS